MGVEVVGGETWEEGIKGVGAHNYMYSNKHYMIVL